MQNMYKNSFNSQEVADFWDSVVGKYEEANAKVQSVHDQRYSEALQYAKVEENLKILNLWSRMGRSLKYFRPVFKNSEIVNMEISPKMLEIAKKRYPDENFLSTNLVNIDWQNDYFDRIISLESLEHSPDPFSLLSEFYRVLKPGGYLIMSLPPATAEIVLIIYELFVDNHGEGPHKFLSYKKVSKMLKKVGFIELKHQPTLIVPFSNPLAKKLNTFLEKHYKTFFLKEFGIRHFYVLQKPSES